jgi:DNA-binding transcriptional ArsR family regulator
MSDKSVLVELGDSRLKEISEVIGSKTCNKILDYLTEKNGTVSDISRELAIPLNTADYNVKKLTSAGLIEKTSHFWSIKGKKMPVYKLSNKKIVISPKKTKSFLSMILAFGIMAILALILRWNMVNIENQQMNYDEPSFAAGAQDRNIFEKALMTSNEEASIQLNDGSNEIENSASKLDSWQWFLVGAWLAIVVFFVISIIDERRRSK